MIRYFFLSAIALLLVLPSATAQQIPEPFRKINDTRPIPVSNNLEDINGHYWDINELLDAGKTVYFFYLSPGDSVTYYFWNSNVLQNFYQAHGPDGDNQAMVFVVASVEVFGNINCINPSINVCYWDFTSNTGGIPIVPLIWDIQPSFYCSNADILTGVTDYMKQLLRVCPNRLTSVLTHRFRCAEPEDNCLFYYEMITPDSLDNSLSFCEASSFAHDASIIYGTADKKAANLPNQVRQTKTAIISNMGSEPLTSAQVNVFWGDSLQETYSWTGNLATYQYDTIELGTFVTDGKRNTLRIAASLPNGVEDENPSNDAYDALIDSAYVISTDSLEFKIRTSTFGSHMGWQLFDSQGIELIRKGCHLLYDNFPEENFPFFNSSTPTEYCSNYGPNYPEGMGDPNYYLGFPSGTELKYVLDFSQSNSESFTLRFLSKQTWGHFENLGYKLHILDGLDTIFNFSDSWYDNDRYYVFRRPDTTSTSQNDWLNPSDLLIKPNPAHQGVQFTWKQEGVTPNSWVVYDAMGRVIWQHAPTNGTNQRTIQLELLNWPDGLYFMGISMPDGRKTVKSFEVRH
jgi:Secretion system C-terminal sorting domain